MIKLPSRTTFPILAATVVAFAATVGAAGLLMLSPTGEQSKLKYDPDLWCVSNYIQDESGLIVRGRPIKDKRLIGKEDWIRREQVKAKSAAEAEEKVEKQYGGFFTRSNKDELRSALDRNDKDFFTHHYNGAKAGAGYGGATAPGPCEGTGDFATDPGLWLADAAREECFDIASSGNCSTKKEQINLKGWGVIDLPKKGKIVQEAHIVTQEEGFQPESKTDRIQRHYKITGNAIDGSFSHYNNWTPAEGGGKIGEGKGGSPPASVEPWIMNMNWQNKPPEGTRMIIKNPANGKTVVAAAGYEEGPGGTSFLLGGQEELMQALGGATTGSTVEVGFAEDQSLPFGPIKCNENETKPASSATPKDSRCPKEVPDAGPMNGEDLRAEFAKAYQAQLQAQNEPSDILAPSETGNNGIPLFRQTDPRWAGKSYGCGNTTIGSSGCGVTSAAMVLKYYGINVDPSTIARYSLSNGHRICNKGTAYSLFPAVAKKYGLKHQTLGWKGVLEALKQGKPVIASMNDNEFSSGGHFIVLTGISSDGKILINDPGPRRIGSASMNTVRNRLKYASLIYK